jgi:hypothetical protein
MQTVHESITAGVPPETVAHGSRRNVLSRLAIASVVAAASAAAIAGETDPHPAWWREAIALRNWLDAPEQEEIEDVGRAAPFARMCDLHDLIALTPARTAAGAAAQLAYVVYLIEHSIPEEREFEALASALAVLERLRGRVVHG